MKRRTREEDTVSARKVVDVVTILVFCFLIFVPNVIIPFIDSFLGVGIGANEASYEMPELRADNLEKFPDEFDEWYSNNMLFRDTMGRKWAQFNYFLLKDSANSGVLFGKVDGEDDSDRWLFYNNVDDYSPVKDAQGLTDYGQDQMDNIVTMMEYNAESAKKHGFELYYLVAPSKESIYGEYLSDSLDFYKHETRMDKLFEYIRSRGVSSFVYPKAKLLEAKEMGQLYFKQDTHWNELGAGVAFKEIISTMRPKWQYDFGYQFERKKTEGDLAKMLKMPGYFTDQIVTIEHRSGSNKYDYSDMGDIESSHNDAAPIKKKVMVIGDSFRTNIGEFFYRTFSDCMLMHRKVYEPGILENFDPDIVILEFVERYSPAIEGFALYAE